MESKIMHNFRKRAKNRGYTNISVKYVRSDYDGHYFKVTAIEPLTGAEVSIENNVCYFNSLFRSSCSWKYRKYEELGGYMDEEN